MPSTLHSSKHVELALVVAALFEFGLAQQHHDVGRKQEQRLEDQRVVVDHVPPVEQRSHAVTGDSEHHDRNETAQQHEAGDRCDRPLLRFGELQIEQQDDVDADRQHDLGRERSPIDRRRRPVAGLGKERGEHQPSVSPRRATSSVTAGLRILNSSCGYTPSTTMPIRNGVQAIHSIGVTSKISSWACSSSLAAELSE